jgi:hypothetical protein
MSGLLDKKQPKPSHTSVPGPVGGFPVKKTIPISEKWIKMNFPIPITQDSA